MRGKPCIKPVVVWRARWWKSWMFTITPRLSVLNKVAVREWYRWVANKGSKKASGGTCLFLGCTAQLTGWRGLVQFAWCGRSWPSFVPSSSRLRRPRSELLSRFDGCHRVPSQELLSIRVLHILPSLQHKSFLPSLLTFASQGTIIKYLYRRFNESR